MESHTIDWQASWIWGGEEASPRNEWRCFRKTFTAPADCANGTIAITADSRYVLYVNGVQVGRGPVRSWPFEQSYDTYEIGHLLKPGGANTIAALVLHFGISTFYYVRGRGGLLAQLELGGAADGEGCRIVSDATWATARHLGQDPRAARMSCQHAFTETIDARAWSDRWIEPGFADEQWERAHIVAAVGGGPWLALKPRDIPPLGEEKVYAQRIESLSRVEPLAWTANIDLRSHFVPGCDDDANAYVFAGYAATVIRAAAAGKATIGFAYVPPLFSGLIVNGVKYTRNEMRGYKTERYIDLQLPAGDNLVMLELGGHDHGRGVFMGVDCEAAFELVSPVAAGSGDSAFIAIGPFECYEYIDHDHGEAKRLKDKVIQACVKEGIDMSAFDEEQRAQVEAFKQIGRAARPADLKPFSSRIRPFPLTHVSRQSVVTLSVWKKSSEPQPVPASLHHALTSTPVPAAVPVYEGADTEFVVDFGRQAVGLITFEIDASAGTVLDFYGYEHMRDGWVQHTYYLENSLRYVCREGRQTFTSFVRKGFRYLAVTVRGAAAAKPAKLYGVQVMENRYATAEIGTFQCSDPLLTDIWRISQLTTKLCMEDTFVDCPAYEQTFWVGDSRNEALIAYYLFGAEDLVKRCLELVPGSRTQTPLYVDQVPSGWNSVIPNWTFFWVIACNEYYKRTGDVQFTQTMWPHASFTLDRYLANIDERGLLCMEGWNFLDWAPIDQPRAGAVTHQNMFLAKALRAASELAAAAGSAGEGMRYGESAEALVRAINGHLWSEPKRAYMDCIHENGKQSDIFSMQTQVVAYLCDIADGARREQMESCLLSTPAGFVPIGSPFMSFFYYEALAKLGRHDLMIDDMRRNYGAMIEYGATTCWETYPKRKDGEIIPTELTRSHCHAWSAAPGYFLGASVLGVRDAAPGWSRVIVEPQTCGLTWARGSVPLPEAGRIDVSWRIDGDGRMNVEVCAPAHVEVDVRLPDGCEGTVRVSRIGGTSVQQAILHA